MHAPSSTSARFRELSEADAFEADSFEAEGDHCVAIITDGKG
jgi:hypothetical protein